MRGMDVGSGVPGRRRPSQWGSGRACRRAGQLIVGTTFLAALPALAAEPIDLYQVVTVVTGQREETRTPAIERSYPEVLFRASGDPRVFSDPGVAGAAKGAPSLVINYTYHDRLAGRPVHDEQGTRDRPHDLTLHFEPAKVDAALQRLGDKPWPSPRPSVAVFLAVQHGPQAYAMSREGQESYGQPDSFAAAGMRYGVPIVVPDRSVLADSHLDALSIPELTPDAAQKATALAGGDVPLVGSMMFSDLSFGWIVDWRMTNGGVTYRWHVQGVNYDEAFRIAVRGAAQILSGHGQPK